MENIVKIDGENLKLRDFYNVVFKGFRVSLSDKAKENIVKSRESLERLLNSGKKIYGVNTGFGSLLTTSVEPKDAVSLQLNLIRSHSAGSGEPLSLQHVLGILLVRANSLSRGYSGVSIDLINKILEFINRRVHIFIPRYGSVGASGDLAPLSHACLAIIGEGEIIDNGKRVKSSEWFKKNEMEQYKLKEKEAISFINGTSYITGVGMVELIRAKENLDLATSSALMSMDALSATKKAFTEWAVRSRKQEGQTKIASFLFDKLSTSKSTDEADRLKIQDAYSIRCTPQVYGAVLDTIQYVTQVLENEMNSTTDNPLIKDEEYVSCGNFHGEPVALVCDFLAIALTDLGNMIERRIARISDNNLSGLPPFLVNNSGINSGFMIAQYNVAALCNRNKMLSWPNSADSIPTCANQEDHVSMGANSAIKLEEINKNLKTIIATEFLMATQAIDLSGKGHSEETYRMHDIIRKYIPFLENDRPIYKDIEKMQNLMEEMKENFKASI